MCLDVVSKPSSTGNVPNANVPDVNPSDDSKMKCLMPTRILQEPRSLLITTSNAYRDLMHGIASVEVDGDLNADTVANWSLLENKDKIEQAGGKNIRETRISLTYRDVLKVSSAATKVLGGFGRR